MALFFKHVTNTLQSPLSPTPQLTPVTSPSDYAFSTSPVSPAPNSEMPKFQIPHPKSRSKTLTSGLSRAASNLRRRGSMRSPFAQNAGRLAATVGDTSASTSGHVTSRSQDLSGESVDDAGPTVGRTSEPHASEVSMAGEAKVYEGDWVIFRISSSTLCTETDERPDPFIGT